MVLEAKTASRETSYWLRNKGGHTPCSTTLHKDFVSLIQRDYLVLDLGCGYGRISDELQKIGARVVAIDPNMGELVIGKRRFLNVFFIQGYGENLPFPAGLFDGVVMLGVLGGVSRQEREDILKAAAVAVKRNGLIYAAEFGRVTDSAQRTFHGNERWIDVYRKDSLITGEYGSVVVHKKHSWETDFLAHHFERKELEDLFDDEGINVIANENIRVRSNISGQLRDTLNIWGSKK